MCRVELVETFVEGRIETTHSQDISHLQVTCWSRYGIGSQNAKKLPNHRRLPFDTASPVRTALDQRITFATNCQMAGSVIGIQ